MGEGWGLLIHIAKNCGLFNSLETSTIKLAKELRTSQQTISRKLRDLEKHKMIKREVSPQGLKIMLDEKGKEYLRKKYDELKKVFESTNIKLKLKLVSGLGEGTHYTDVYKEKIKEIIGLDPCPGTLNIKGKKEEIVSFLSELTPIKVEGFTKGDRTYGAINCYKVLANNYECVIVVPDRTSHDKDILELISDSYLRAKLKINNGDVVELCQKQ